MVSKEKIKQFLNDNESKEYSREKRKYPYILQLLNLWIKIAVVLLSI